MRLFLAAALLAVSGCVPATPPPPRAVAPPVAAPRPVPPSPVAVDWRDWPVTPGSWRYARDERSTAATFGKGGEVSAVLRCDLANRRLFLSRAGADAGPFTVRTTSITRQLATGATGGEPAYVAAPVAANDPLLDAIAFSRGRFTLEQPGRAPLVLPPWAEVGRVIEDCRG